LGEIDEPPSLHRYLYANANPTSFVDPTGQFSVKAAWETVKGVPRALAEPALEVYDVALVAGAKVMGIPSDYIELQSALGRRQQQRIEEGQSVATAATKGSAEVAAAVVTRGLSVVGQSYGETAVDWYEGELTIDELDERLTSTGVGTGIAAGTMALGQRMAQSRATQQPRPASTAPRASRVVEGSNATATKVPAATASPQSGLSRSTGRASSAGSTSRSGGEILEGASWHKGPSRWNLIEAQQARAASLRSKWGHLSASERKTLLTTKKIGTTYRRYYREADRYYAGRRLTVKPGQHYRTVLGQRIDSQVRARMRIWAGKQGLGHEEGLFINRRLYDFSGSGRYRIPDVRYDPGKMIWEGTIAPKTYLRDQVLDFSRFSRGHDVELVKP
jgi:hypothetical protein